MATSAQSRARSKRPAAFAAENAKADLIAALQDVRRRILQTAAEFAPGLRDQVFLGTWSARDLIAHLIGWDYTNLAAIDEVLVGSSPRFFEAYDRDWRTYNASLVNQYTNSNYRSLLRQARRSHRALIERIRLVPADDLRNDTGVRAGGSRVTIERLMKAELADERTHLEQLAGLAVSLARNQPGKRTP